MRITKEEFQQLLTSEGFKLFKRYLKKLEENEKEGWARGAYTTELADGTIQLNAAAIGRVKLLQELQSDDLTYEVILETVNDRE
jgi:hypothetical protein